VENGIGNRDYYNFFLLSAFYMSISGFWRELSMLKAWPALLLCLGHNWWSYIYSVMFWASWEASQSLQTKGELEGFLAWSDMQRVAFQSDAFGAAL